MVRLSLCLLVLVAGCYEDRYRCSNHEQCDIGQGGRCEVDDFCTQRDLECDTLREYTDHSAELSNQCFDDTVVPLNACAGGQPAAKPQGACFTKVCDQLPSCCKVGWTDACVQLAQETVECDLACDLRIALTATKGSTIERWDVRWDGSQWSQTQRNDLAALSWVAPAPGTIEPRLAGVTATDLVIGDSQIPIEPDRTYSSITSIAFDRDRRDTIVTAFAKDGNKIEVWKLDTNTSTLFTGLPGSASFTWGDEDRDTYPDAVGRTGNNYSFLHNHADSMTFEREFLNQTTVMVNTGGTSGASTIRSFDWIDFNADNRLDLAMFGADLRIHMTNEGLAEGARLLDCDPPTTTRECTTANPADLEFKMVSYAGAALPTASGPSLLISTYPHRRMYRIYPNGDVVPFAPPNDTCTCTQSCTNCPGSDCNCTYNCNACSPVIALVVRDIDHDHRLDVVAIDATLKLYIAKAENDYAWGGPTQINAVPNTFVTIDVSVSGAPIP